MVKKRRPRQCVFLCILLAVIEIACVSENFPILLKTRCPAMALDAKAWIEAVGLLTASLTL